MENWFREEKPPEYPSESRTSVLKGESGGRPLFARRNDSAAILAKHPEFRFRVGVAVPLNYPNEHGLPSADEILQLDVIEDALTAQLEAGRQSIQVLVITTDGMREFVFYTRDSALAKSVIEALKTTIKSHEIQWYVDEDPEWKVYKTFSHDRFPPPT